MRSWTLLPILLLGCLLPLAAAGQSIPPGRAHFMAFGPDQGFPNAAIHTLAQDRHGYLWLGTENGLIRYDGSRTTRWGMAEGLPSDWVIRLQPDPQGGLWVGTSQGLVHFQDGQVEHPQAPPGLLEHSVLGMDLDAQGKVWVAGHQSLVRQVEGLHFEPVPGWTGSIRSVACGPRTGSVWVCGTGGISEYRANGTWRSLGVKEGLPLRPAEMVEDLEGNLWAVTGPTLLVLPYGGQRFVDHSRWMPGPAFNSSHPYRDPSGALWFPTTRGLLEVAHGQPHVLDRSRGLPTSWARAALRDREGNFWMVSTNLFEQLGQGFLSNYNTDDGLPSDVVWSVCMDPAGVLWAGTDDGACIYRNGQWERVKGTEGMLVLGISQDRLGGTWFISTTGPLAHLAPRADRAERILDPGAPPRTTWVCNGPDGRVWFAALGSGVVTKSPSGGPFHVALQAATFGFKEVVIHRMEPDAEGRVWCAADQGLFGYVDGKWHHWSTPDGLLEEQLLGVYPMPDGTLWIWYNEPKGLTHLKLEGDHLKVLGQVDSAHGLLTSDLIYALAPSVDGSLWITSDRGVDRLQGATLRHFGRSSGMVTEDCSANGLLVSQDQDVWVASSAGLVRIQTTLMPKAPEPPTPDILTLFTGSKVWLGPYGDLPPIPHRQASLEFRFSSPTYVDEQEIAYEYQLKGLETQWHRSDVHQARYPVLPGGTYEFQVRAARPGSEFGPIASLSVTVEPPWWRTWWFYGLETLALGGILFLIIEWRLHAVRSQKRALEAEVSARTQELSTTNAALQKANASLHEQNTTDPLTGLRNRRFLTMAIGADLARMLRVWHQVPPRTRPTNGDLVFFMVDLDHFKTVNDTHGHHAGDEVLIQMGRILRDATRDSDSVIRWGGEEFLVIARDTNREEAPFVAERIRSAVAAHAFRLEEGSTLRCTCSIGFAAFPFFPREPEWAGWEPIVDFADHGLYAVKHQGRNGWAGLAPGSALSPSLDPHTVAADLNLALAEGWLELIRKGD